MTDKANELNEFSERNEFNIQTALENLPEINLDDFHQVEVEVARIANTYNIENYLLAHNAIEGLKILLQLQHQFPQITESQLTKYLLDLSAIKEEVDAGL